jgi:NADPH-dependent 2,4-dienoyl-CoA reductase/sulfur reductase-like enzyme/nitrite reductase/ring-hydroxylating ferredoxin subunit
MTDTPAARDLAAGIPWRELADGAIVSGRIGDEDVIVVRRGDEIFAVGAHCTHYHGPLADGLVVGDTIRCPWHHACFSLRTGEAVRAPALDAIRCWHAERVGDTVFVRERPVDEPSPHQAAPAARRASDPKAIVIVGGGAAGLAAADMLRRRGYEGTLTMISADDSAPCDRPNLSKDFLAGKAEDDWIPLRSPDFYTEQRIDLVLGTRVESLDPAARLVRLADGTTRAYDALLLATGADPAKLDIPGAAAVPVFYLRTFADSRAIVAGVSGARRVIVVGASFIGLEVAASLRARGIEVDVVAPEQQPLVRVMGAEIGAMIRGVHEAHGVTFHLGTTVTRVDGRVITLGTGSTIEADAVVVGVGVRPSVALAEQAGLKMDHGVLVDEYLETSAPGVFAAGDIARWPDPYSGTRIRVEHWVVAERQGQTAARNMLGLAERFGAVPFFWSQHYDMTINYVGHAETWDRIEIDGRLDQGDAVVRYLERGQVRAVATIGRDLASLEAESRMEAASARSAP